VTIRYGVPNTDYGDSTTRPTKLGITLTFLILHAVMDNGTRYRKSQERSGNIPLIVNVCRSNVLLKQESIAAAKIQ